MDSEKDRAHSDLRKMFVGGLSSEHTTEAGVAKIKEHFSQWGSIDEVVVLKKENPQGDRLFGFVTFCEVDDPDKVFKARPHSLEGKVLEVKRAVPKGHMKDIESHTFKTKKLFVANIPSDTGLDPSLIQSELQCEIEKGLSNRENGFGWIEPPVLVKNKDQADTTKYAKDKAGYDSLRGIAFITCESEDVADRLALTRKSFEYRGKTVEVKKSYENNLKSGGGRGRGRGGRGQGHGQQHYYGGGYGGGYGGYGGGYGSYDQGGYGQYHQGWYGQPPAHSQAGKGGRRGRGQQHYQPAPY